MRGFRRQVTVPRAIVLVAGLALWSVAVVRAAAPVTPVDVRVFNFSGEADPGASVVIRVVDVGGGESSLFAIPGGQRAYVALTLDPDSSVQVVDPVSCGLLASFDFDTGASPGVMVGDSRARVSIDQRDPGTAEWMSDSMPWMDDAKRVAPIPQTSKCAAYERTRP